MFDSALVPRLLVLPADVRGALAGVEGPGWAIYEYPVHYVRTSPYRICLCREPSDYADPWARQAWWPANPAAAVAAVLDCTLAAACEHLLGWPNEHEDIEHPNAPGLLDDAALTLIEAHVASRSQS